jgi:hypothetical protein
MFTSPSGSLLKLWCSVISPLRGRKHKATGVNPWAISRARFRARVAGEGRHRIGFCRPFHGLEDLFAKSTQGCHPGLYDVTRSQVLTKYHNFRTPLRFLTYYKQ